MRVAVEMEINFCARLNLRKTATGGAAFHSKYGAERRLTRGDDDFLADVGEALGKADGGDGLAFAGGGGRCGGDDD